VSESEEPQPNFFEVDMSLKVGYGLLLKFKKENFLKAELKKLI
jgi:hypothetical protein